ncbi:MAG TPA: VOC family protein [Mycobacteriales bacterium]|nr:VOC family protein [Mycobacteriales bacterium]
MLEVGVVVVGVTDRDRASAFWCAALSYRPRSGPFGGWEVVLEPSDGRTGARIALQRSESAPGMTPRMHLDLHVRGASEHAREIDRLIGLGATRVDWQYPDDPDFVVLADPELNLFCVVDLDHEQ